MDRGHDLPDHHSGGREVTYDPHEDDTMILLAFLLAFLAVLIFA